MPVLNHQIVWSVDADRSAAFLSRILGLGPAVRLGHFAMVEVSPDVTFDFMATDRAIMANHYAFLVSDNEFDEIFERIRAENLTYWSDPQHRGEGQINYLDDGRGVYFDDPSGHELEMITRPYGSGGLEAAHPNPLLLEQNRESGRP